MTFDWGYGRPFSIGWWWCDGDNRLYRFAEWYGWAGVPNEGLRLPDTLIAEGIKEREAKLGISNSAIIRLAGPDCWNKKPDYKGGGQGPSTEEVFSGYGIYMSPGDPSRAAQDPAVPRAPASARRRAGCPCWWSMNCNSLSARSQPGDG
jgi:hypothetical protein